MNDRTRTFSRPPPRPRQMKPSSNITIRPKMSSSKSTSASPEKMAGFEDMPQEIVDAICNLVESTRSLKALRRTNRHMRNMTENVFATRTFDNIEVTLTRENLSYLYKVACNAKYAPCVRTIYIVPRYKFFMPHVRNLQQHVQEQSQFRQSGEDSEALAICLAALTKLDNIHVGRFRDPQEREALSQRLSSTWETENYSFDDCKGGPKPTVKAIAYGFQVLLSALSKCDRPLDKISAGCAPYYDLKTRNSIDHLVLRLPQTPNLRSNLSRLTELNLVLEIRSTSSDLHCETYLADLLKQTTSLKTLSLSFPETYCAWLAGLPTVALPALTSLTINKAHDIRALELYQFIGRHKTLKTLELKLLQFTELNPFTGLLEALQGLTLNKLLLQQLLSVKAGCRLMLFGGSLEKVCPTCYEDLEAAYHYRDGPACAHATIAVKGETEINRELPGRFRVCHLIPRINPAWSKRGEIYQISSFGEGYEDLPGSK